MITKIPDVLEKSPGPCTVTGRHVYPDRPADWRGQSSPRLVSERCRNVGGKGDYPRRMNRCTVHRVWRRKKRVPWERSIAGYFRSE